MTEDQKPAETPADKLEFACLGCHVTYAEIARLQLDVHFNHMLPRSDEMLPLCSRCERDHAVLATVLTEQMHLFAEHDHPERRGTIAALWAVRDRLVVDEAINQYRYLAHEADERITHQGMEIELIRERLGMTASTKSEKKPLSAKTMVLGALLGSVVGMATVASAKPLDYLRFIAETIQRYAPKKTDTSGDPGSYVWDSALAEAQAAMKAAGIDYGDPEERQVS